MNFCVETIVEMLLCLPLVKSECSNFECREKLGSSAKSSTITNTEKGVSAFVPACVKITLDYVSILVSESSVS